MENVVVIGASAKPERYSSKAIKMLSEYGHNPIPIAPLAKEILGYPALPTLSAIETQIDTVTMYVGPERQAHLIEPIVSLRPKRVIFNPGAENPDHYARLREVGIDVVEACTLVLLRTGQF